MNFKLLGIFLVGIIAMNSCNIVNPKEGIPTYIQIDSVQLNATDIAKHGSVKHKITDVWVYYERQLLGAFELPAKIPVLATGKGQLQIVAGIWDNGLSGTRAKYPFYNLDTFTFEASPTNTINYTPKFTYRTTENILSYYVENFEQGNSFIKRAGDSTLTRTNEKTDVFEEDWSGKIELNDSVKAVEIITAQEYLLPPNKEAYLELNYKSDIDFKIRAEIYHLGSFNVLEVMGVKSKSEWNKIFLNLSGFSSTYQYGKFKFIITANKPSDMAKAKVLIDNFKIIYYN